MSIPFPVCKDKKTGEWRWPRPDDTADTCEVATVDDPLKWAGKSVLNLALLVALAVYVGRKLAR